MVRILTKVSSTEHKTFQSSILILKVAVRYSQEAQRQDMKGTTLFPYRLSSASGIQMYNTAKPVDAILVIIANYLLNTPSKNWFNPL